MQHGLLVDTAAGMAYLYNNGVEHRDLKSANCLVTHDWRVKVGFVFRIFSAALSSLIPLSLGDVRLCSLPLED